MPSKLLLLLFQHPLALWARLAVAIEAYLIIFVLRGGLATNVDDIDTSLSLSIIVFRAWHAVINASIYQQFKLPFKYFFRHHFSFTRLALCDALFVAAEIKKASGLRTSGNNLKHMNMSIVSQN